MGKDSYSILHRRYKMKNYLVRVGITNYKRLKEMFDVSDKTISADLDFIRDELGVWLETKTGVGGYVRINPQWHKNQIRFTSKQTQYLLKVYRQSSEEERRVVQEMLEWYANPALIKEIYDDEV